MVNKYYARYPTQWGDILSIGFLHTMTEHSQETKIAIGSKVDHMTDHVKELTLRVRANEKVVLAVTLLGTVVLAVQVILLQRQKHVVHL